MCLFQELPRAVRKIGTLEKCKEVIVIDMKLKVNWPLIGLCFGAPYNSISVILKLKRFYALL